MHHKKKEQVDLQLDRLAAASWVGEKVRSNNNERDDVMRRIYCTTAKLSGTKSTVTASSMLAELLTQNMCNYRESPEDESYFLLSCRSVCT
jgi:DNA phosphorothioation-dependent restriction protein DptG